MTDNTALSKLTIIIPVYNAEEYLRACIESILAEKICALDLLLIDDGSTDSSLDICAEYSNKYSFISHIYKNNEGPGVARNIGIHLVKSKYLMFVDADDLLKIGSGEYINRVLQTDFDVCFLGAEQLFPDGKTKLLNDCIASKRINHCEHLKALEYLSTRPRFPGSPCTKIFKTSFLREHSIQFPLENHCAEDLIFVFNAIKYAKRFSAVDETIYRYRQYVLGSRSSNLCDNHKRIMYFIDAAVDTLVSHSSDITQEAKYLLSFVTYEYFILLLYLPYLLKHDYNEYSILMSYLSEKVWLLDYAYNRKIRALCFLTKMIGIENISKVICLIKKNKLRK